MSVDTDNIGKGAYSSYYGWEENPLKCLDHLMMNNEKIWKLLKYDTPDAWNDDIYPNLTHAEKAAMVYDGNGDLTRFKVFLDIGQDESFDNQTAILRLTNYSLEPTERPYGLSKVIFEIYCHYQINQMSNRVTRVDTIIQQLLQTFNGKDVFGMGKLFFDRRGAAALRAEVGGQIPFRGKWILFGNWQG